MTKEEAIKIIEEAFETWKSEFGEGDWGKEDEALSMAISALEKENIYDDKEHYVTISKALYDKLNVDACDDTISREAVIYLVSDMRGLCRNDVLNDTLNKIQHLPSVQPSRKGHWISVSERLPERNKRVIVCYETMEGLKVDTSIFDKYGCLIGKAVAWMPLPEPIQGYER